MVIRLFNSADKDRWDSYVLAHPDSTHCHLSAWKEIIENTYHHKTYYLIAEKCLPNPINSSNPSNPSNPINSMNSAIPYALCPMRGSARIVGILPLVHIKSRIFGNQLVSLPFLNYGGIIANDEQTEKELVEEAVRIGQELNVGEIELRHIRSIPWAGRDGVPLSDLMTGNISNTWDWGVRSHKVRMVLPFPENGEALWKSYNAKLRSQIQRPKKEGMTFEIGGMELTESFYDIFSVNMRDLGSPVHSKRLFEQTISIFKEKARIGIVYYQDIPVAAGLIICFKNMVEIPWASSLRKFNRLGSNMLLYWSFLEYTCNQGARYFDFGRSTPGEGTFKFKEQWGARPQPLYWYHAYRGGTDRGAKWTNENTDGKMIEIWQRLPLLLANYLGPKIRGDIPL